MNENGLENGTPGLTGFEIAVIGMSGRFPGASNIEEFWDNLKDGREGISFFSDEELQEAGIPGKLINNPKYVKGYGWMEEILCFDAEFFSYTPLEAEIMDPQVRLFHQCTYEALEDAGYDTSTYKKLIGIYAGASASFDWQSRAELSGKTRIFGWFAAKQLTDKDFLSTRVAYNLDLKGPAVTVDTACSTSLTAIHLACQGLISGDCDMALAGGVTAPLFTHSGYLYQEGMINASDGHCRAFDARADGSNFGNAVAIVVLKRYTDAADDGDNIYAMIKGSAINNDGDRKAAYTAPSIDGQAGAIRTALRMAEVDPETVTYVETHGTGTTLGDPVEIEGLEAAFNTKKKHFCRIGSVKTNLGHLEMAAGVTGFIKTVLALKHRQIPPSLYFETPNPKINFDNSAFVVNTQLTEWKRLEPGLPLRAGVSSFGIGGTNAHVILEEAPIAQSAERKTQSAGRQYQLILLSAKTETALDQMTQNLARHFQKHPGIQLADAAYTLQVGRQVFPYRRMLVCPSNDTRQAVDLLAPGSGKVKTHQSLQDNRPIIFMFSGLGGQYVNMGRDLYQNEPIFRSHMDRCFEILNHLVDYDIKEILYPRSDNSPLERGAPQGRGVLPDINQPGISQVVIFIFEYALAQLLMSWGIKPYALIGYSFGEYTAACISGVFSLENGLKLVVSRGKLLQETPPGAMLSVPLPCAEIIPLLNSNAGLSLSIDNGPSCVVSGPNALIDEFEKQMKEKRVICMRVPAERAIHSTMMDTAAEKLARLLGTIPLNKPGIPYVSNVTGDWLTEKDAANPAYWARHLRETVRFADGMKTLLKQPGAVLIELGPGRDISTLALRYLENDNDAQSRVLNLVRPQHQDISDVYFLLNRVGRLWLLGQPIDWTGFYENQKNLHKRVSLPTYPFESQIYKVTLDNKQEFLANLQEESRPIPAFADWFYIPTWTPHLLLPKDDPHPSVQYHWLVFIDHCGLGQTLVKRLKQKGHEVTIVEPGNAFIKQNPGTYMINPGQVEDYYRLFKELGTRPTVPGHILHLWGVTGTDTSTVDIEGFEKAQEPGFYSLLYTAKAIGRAELKNQFQIDVITDQMQEVTGEESLCPAKATVIGAVRVIPQEFPGIRCRSIDVVLPEPGSMKADELADQLEEEVLTDTLEPVIAYRASFRWIQTFQPLKLDSTRKNHLKLRENGVYLVTGGLGSIGLMLADYLARKVKAKLILTGRTPLPRRNEWEQWLRNHDETNSISQKIKQLKILEESGAEVRVFSVDTADKEKMQEIISQAENQLGPINGIIHAAGIMTGKSFSSIQQLEIADCQEQFHPKVKGLLVLEELFADKPLDFCWLLSSISTVLGRLGITAYAAANSFIDALAKKHNRTHAIKWISVDWDGMDAEKTQVSFERILSLGKVTQVVASNGGNLPERINRWVKLESLEEKEKITKKEVKSRKPRPDLMNPFVPPEGDLQQKLVNIWQRLFGFEQVGIQDDFIELGGDSLKAITMINQVQKEADVPVPLSEFFKNPTIKHLSQHIIRVERVAHQSIKLMEKKEYYPLSFAQKRLYILQQVNKDSIAYNESQALLQERDPDKEKLEKIFKCLIERHASLRTSFAMVKDEPMQKIHENVEFKIEYYDMKEAPYGQISSAIYGGDTEGTGGLAPMSNAPLPEEPSTRNSQPVTALISPFIRPFDLSRAPLLRVRLIKFPHTPTARRGCPSQEGKEHRYLLMVDLHHIITDGTSNQILLKEFNALHRGEELPALCIQYKDYCQWQNSEKERLARTKQEKYWLKEFEGELPILDLPTDYPRPAIQTFEGKTASFAVNHQEVRTLNTLLSEENATPNMKLLAIFSIFLFKMSGQEDIIVGIPTAGRRHSDLENIIGMLVNTLAIRNYPQREKTFKEFLNEVKEKTLRDFENQEYPFEELIDRLNLNRDLGRNPLFDVSFALQNMESQEELSLNPYRYENRISKFDLTLYAFESKNNLVLSLEYSTKLFQEATIKRFISYIKRIISSVIRHPHQKLGEIDILSEQEINRILFTFNDTTADYSADKTLHRLFREQVKRTPDKIAAVGKENTAPLDYTAITYRQLNEKSHQLAAVLKEKGVKSDAVVGIMIPRSLEMIIGIMGILEAGGAYLPIDPDYPQDRIDFMLKDSSAQVLVVADTSSASRLSFAPKALLNLSAGHHLNFPASQLPGFPASLLSTLAYIIYTSGSTGKPKGTAVNHCSVNNYTNWFKREFEITREDKFCFSGSFCFDMSVTSLIIPLISGSAIYMLMDKIEREPQLYANYLAKNSISIIKLTPTQFKWLLDFIQEGETGSLRWIILGGEAVDGNDVRKYLTYYKHQKVVNEYGPTEATVASVFHVVSGNKPPGTGTAARDDSIVPIGKPIFNTQVYILDEYLKVVPINVTGELCIGGAGLTRGYLNKPELTAEKFCLWRPGGALFEKTAPPGPPRKNFLLNKMPGKNYMQPYKHANMQLYPLHSIHYHIYKTGDRARWMEDGKIQYLGRMDTQVKIKGYRIEPGEIETVLAAYAGIKNCALEINEDARGNKNLVAYLVINEDKDDTIAKVKKYLKNRLPEYMIPSIFIPLDELPMTVSGKLARNKLPHLSTLQLPHTEIYKRPEGEKEKILADTWEKVLGLSRVGVNENFFELGGDSIKAIQVISRLLKYKYTIQVRDLFLNPTIKQLNKYMKKVVREIPQEPTKGDVELTPIQLWFFENYCSNNNLKTVRHYNQAVMIYRSEGFDPEIVQKVFAKIVRHHDALRMAYRLEKGTIVQTNRGQEGKLFHLEISHIPDMDTDTEIEAEIEKEAQRIQRGIDLGNGPLVCLGLFKTNRGDHLLMAIHHLVVDGVSWRILLEDFQLGYQQAMNGKEIIFQEKTDSFQYWAMKLKEYSNSPEAAKELEYWKTVKETKTDHLPPDSPIPPGKKHLKQRSNRETLTMILPEKETGKLLKSVNRLYNTEINDILLAALGLALKDWAGIQDVLIDLEGHGREEILADVNVSRTVGWFTTLFPLVLHMKRAEELSYFIKVVKETLRRVPGRGIGYGILRYLTEGTTGKTVVQPAISFNYLGEFGQENRQEQGFLSFSPFKTGDNQAPQLPGLYLLEIYGIVTSGRLALSFNYNKYEYQRKTIKKLEEAYRTNLEKIIRHCTKKSGSQRELTPSDLDYQEFTIDELSGLEREFREKNWIIQNIYPLSPMQEGMLFHTIYQKNTSAYFEQLSFRLHGHLDISCVKKSLEVLFKRYDILRTVFIYEGLKRPLQVVLEERQPDFCLEDTGDKDKETFIEAFEEKDKQRSFDPSKDVLMRVSIIRAGQSQYQLTWSFHHILMDGWCIGIMISDYFEIYNSFIEDRPYQLPAVIPYRSYIKWLENRDKAKSKSHWRDYLEGYNEPASLPKIISFEPVDTNKVNYKSEEKVFTFTKNETTALDRLGQENRVTLNTIIRAVWGIILGKYNNKQDIVFGAVVSGRPPEIENVESIVGLFINTIPVRIKYEKDTPFTSLLQEIQEDALNSEFHHYYPLAEIQAHSTLNRNLFDHILVFENYPVSEYISMKTHQHPQAGQSSETTGQENLELSRIKVFEQSNYDLDLIIVPGDRLSIRLRYNGNRLGNDVVDKIQKDFKSVIRQVLDNPGIKIHHLELTGKYYALSPLQQDLYRQIKENQGLVVPNVFTLKWLEPELDNKKVEQVFHRLINKHESLRTSFREMGDRIVQVVHDIDTMTFDIKTYKAAEDDIPGIINEFIRPFDLNQAPLLEVGIIEPQERKYILMINSHRMIADAFSHGILTREFTEMYQGKEIPSSNLHYRDYSQALDNETGKEKMRKQKEYWLKELSGKLPVLNLPGDYPGPMLQQVEVEGITFEIGTQQEKALRELWIKEGLRPDLVFLALYCVLLSKITRQEDIAVGVVSAARSSNEWEKVMGLFENTLILRNYPVKEKTFPQFLTEVSEKAAMASNNMDYPLGFLAGQLVTNRDFKGNFPGEAWFQYHKEDGSAFIPGEVNLPAKKKMNADLNFHLYETRGKIILEFEYNPQRFKKEVVERFVRYFREMVLHIVRNKDTRLKDIPVSHDLHDGKSLYKEEEYIHFEF